jgi:hypothetical protein
MTRSTAQLASVALVCLLTPLGAQNLPPTRPDLPAGAVIRVEALSGERIEGRFEQYRADSLWLSRAALGPTGVPLGTLSRVWVKGRATKTGMLVGGLVGIPLGVLLGASLCGFERLADNTGKDIGCTEHYVGGTAAGVAVGVGLGALVGRFIPKWHVRFRLAP